MAKTKISEFDSNPANNTDIDGINLAEGMAPGLVNNAIRELMAQLKDFQSGASGDSLTLTGTLTLNGNVADAFPSGTKMLFQQTAAPTGWTKDTTNDNKALRVVSGTAGTGGSIDFTTAFGSQNVGATALTEAQMPSHTHAFSGTTGIQSANHTHSGTTSGVGDHVHGSPPGLSGPYLTNPFSGDGQIDTSGFTGPQERNTTTANSAGAGAHSHSFTTGGVSANHNHSFSGTTGSKGSGATHTHTLDLSVSYIDVIVCEKD